MFKIILIYPGHPDKLIEAGKATREEIVSWINQAPTFENRQYRKQLFHAYTYGAGPKRLIDLGEFMKSNLSPPP